MTVAELIEELQKMPHNMTVFRDGGDYKDDWREVRTVEISRQSSLGTPAGVYLK